MHSDNIKVSVILPAYNAEQFLADLLDSVVGQTMNNFEVIAINDGSSDGTQEILDRYEKNYPSIFRIFQQENMGQSATRNHALQYVKGTYVAFIDADDILEKDYLETLYNACYSNDADIAIGGYEKFYSDTNEVFYYRRPSDWDVTFRKGLHHVFIYSPWGKLYKTAFLIDHNFRFSEGEHLEDGPYAVMTHIVADKVVTVDRLGYKYRMYSSSVMGNVRKKQSAPKLPYRGVIDTIQQVRKYKPDKETDQMLEYCIIKLLAGLTTNMCKNVDADTRKEICNYCYETLSCYFPEAKKNPYVKLFSLKKLPVIHRLAVSMFMKAYRLHLLYPFSSVASKFL